jgi:multiple sugar transport system substrate-binding protein
LIKKGFLLALVFSMGVSLIACSSGETKKDSGPVNKPTAKRAKMVFWDKSEFVKDYNDMQKAKVEQFGKDNNIEVEYVIVSPNELKARLEAAIVAGNPPDLVAMDDFVAKQFVSHNKLVDVSDILNKVKFRDEAKKIAYSTAGLYEVPLYFNTNAMYVRKDKLEEKNLPLPKTWEDVLKVARAINDPINNFYGAGFPLGVSGGLDAEGWLGNLIKSYGGVPVNEKGEVTINSTETLEALKFATTFYSENLTPPGSTNWDDSGNNNAYLAGTIGITFNSGSILAAMRKDKPDLVEKTIILPYPAGSKAQFGVSAENVYIMFKGNNVDAAKKYVESTFEKEYYQKLVESLRSFAQPVVEGYESTEFWQKAENKIWYDSTRNAIPLSNPAPLNETASRVLSEQLITKGIQKHVINKTDIKQALAEIEKEYNRVYGKVAETSR